MCLTDSIPRYLSPETGLKHSSLIFDFVVEQILQKTYFVWSFTRVSVWLKKPYGANRPCNTTVISSIKDSDVFSEIRYSSWSWRFEVWCLILLGALFRDFFMDF